MRIASQIEQTRRSFRFAGEYEGLVAEGLTPGFTRQGAPWSASRLESYLTCSFQFFGKYVLGLRELDEEAEEGGARYAALSSMEILQEAFDQPTVKDDPLTDWALNQVIAYIDIHGKEKWDAAPEKEGFGRAALWRLGWQRIRDQIVDMLDLQFTWNDPESPYRVLGTELRFGEWVPTDPPMQINGTIDRVDVSPKHGLFIYDYKTGRIPSKKSVLEGTSPQLPLYAYAMRQHPRGQDAVIHMSYAKLHTPERLQAVGVEQRKCR